MGNQISDRPTVSGSSTFRQLKEFGLSGYWTQPLRLFVAENILNEIGNGDISGSQDGEYEDDFF
jgi:hypothetical protein